MVPGSHPVHPVVPFALLLLFLLPVPLRSQEAWNGEERPRVERIRFEGNDALGASALRAAIVHQPTRCRSIVLSPVCWVTDWNVIVERNYLDPQELPRDELRLRVFHVRRGYREAQVRSEVRPRGRGVELVFRIEQGEPTVIESVEVEQVAEVFSERQILRAALPRAGEALDLVRLDTALAHLAARLGERGYLDAVIHDTVEIAPAARSARVEVRIDPRSRSTVNGIEIVGNQAVADGTITNALRVRQGNVLRTRDIAASQRSLYESNLFHEARVVVPEGADSAKTVRIEVREAPQHAARVGAGFNTIDFVQTEARFTDYNFLGGGRRFDARATLGNLLAPQLSGRGLFHDVLPDGIGRGDDTPFLRPTWLASVDLMQPAFRASANTLGLSAFAHRRIIPGIVVDRGYGADLSLTRRFDYDAPVTLSYRFEQTAVDAGELYFCVNYGICDLATVGVLQQRHGLSPVSLSFFTDRADNPLAPTRGYRTRLDLEHASGVTLSDFHYHRLSGEVTRYLPFGVQRRRVLAGRLRAGWVRPLGSTGAALGVDAGDEGLLHPRKRFYAGGARSVRGYGENQLGPRILTVDPQVLRGRAEENGAEVFRFCPPATPIAACDPNRTVQVDDGVVAIGADAFVPRPLGGTGVLEASVEYRFPVWGPLQGALFVDGAFVGQRLDAAFENGIAAVTPGFGARFATPVGPIRVDLGIRPTIVERLPVITEEELNGERRLVRLQQTYRYDPVGVDGSWYQQVLQRLTLHLSIGEAF